MTSYEQPWQPQTFVRFIQSFDTATSTAQIMTDQGEGFLKALGNRGGPHLLACELVATQLARLFDLPTFDFAIMEITEDDDIPFARGKHAEPGPAFITQREEGRTWGGSEEELSDIENPHDISRLIIFDTWTLNCDRYPPDLKTRKPNYDNVFLSTEGESSVLKAMDHTHCFTCGSDLTAQAANIDRVQDERIYGLFPGFLPYLRREDLNRAINDLRLVSKPEVKELVESIPPAWQVDQPSREALIELICRRAAFIVDNENSIIGSIEDAANQRNPE